MSDGQRPYHWFQGASVQELCRQLNDAGPNARLEVHQEGLDMKFQVKPPLSETAKRAGIYPEINESHVCPPQC